MVWELVRFTGMTKNQVLEEIYPDEVPDLLKKANIERARQRQKELTGYFYTLMAPVLPWLKDDSTVRELTESIISELKQIHEYLRGKGEGTNETSEQINQESNQQEQQEDPFERLKKLQGLIAQTKTRKKAR